MKYIYFPSKRVETGDKDYILGFFPVEENQKMFVCEKHFPLNTNTEAVHLLINNEENLETYIYI